MIVDDPGRLPLSTSRRRMVGGALAVYGALMLTPLVLSEAAEHEISDKSSGEDLSTLDLYSRFVERISSGAFISELEGRERSARGAFIEFISQHPEMSAELFRESTGVSPDILAKMPVHLSLVQGGGTDSHLHVSTAENGIPLLNEVVDAVRTSGNGVAIVGLGGGIAVMTAGHVVSDIKHSGPYAKTLVDSRGTPLDVAFAKISSTHELSPSAVLSLRDMPSDEALHGGVVQIVGYDRSPTGYVAKHYASVALRVSPTLARALAGNPATQNKLMQSFAVVLPVEEMTLSVDPITGLDSIPATEMSGSPAFACKNGQASLCGCFWAIQEIRIKGKPHCVGFFLGPHGCQNAYENPDYCHVL